MEDTTTYTFTKADLEHLSTALQYAMDQALTDDFITWCSYLDRDITDQMRGMK